jgi:hypothetical protein
MDYIESCVVPPKCVVCGLLIEPTAEAPGINAWPVDNEGPKHWDCWLNKTSGSSDRLTHQEKHP